MRWLSPLALVCLLLLTCPCVLGDRVTMEVSEPLLFARPGAERDVEVCVFNPSS